jgi:putative ABC transport system ATP-binding protein
MMQIINGNRTIESPSVIHAENIIKTYNQGTENELEILHGINLDIKRGEFVSIVGQSGSGKSTLMNILGLLDRPTSGNYFMNGQDMNAAPDKALARIRNKSIGFVFQNYNLIARTNGISNVELPMLYAGLSPRARKERAIELLHMVGMENRMDHTPDELSGGQKQRVAIARAMANDPDVILADEPTGALDSKTGHMVMDIFHRLHEEEKKTIILITHSNELAAETSRIIHIKDGEIVPA